jgi:hypothetical protein
MLVTSTTAVLSCGAGPLVRNTVAELEGDTQQTTMILDVSMGDTLTRR